LRSAVVIERQAEVEGGLAAEAQGDGVGFFFFDDARDDFFGEWLEINRVGHVAVGLDGGDVGVDQDGLNPLLFERHDGLRAGIIELTGLADFQPAGTKN
jgi:hypothetical protein